MRACSSSEFVILPLCLSLDVITAAQKLHSVTCCGGVLAKQRTRPSGDTLATRVSLWAGVIDR
jgi:hypothetical protein